MSILFFVQCRQHPEQYEYFNNYDNLEVDYILFSYVLLACFYGMIALFLINTPNFISHIHFHQEHFLCEDEACLAKQFIVFVIEGDIY
jgi:hypothetical protein